MAQPDDGEATRPVSGAGVRDMMEEEEPVGRHADLTPVPSSDAGIENDEAAPSPTISSASESAPPPTARDLQRVKRGLIRATEHLSESLADAKGQLWEKVDDSSTMNCRRFVIRRWPYVDGRSIEGVQSDLGVVDEQTNERTNERKPFNGRTLNLTKSRHLAKNV